jgi:galactose mutarotase-like enzyme
MQNDTNADADWICLSSDTLTVQIDPLGAQLSVLRDRAGRDLLWDGNPSIWAGRAPLLFPIVGALNGGAFRLGAKRYELPRHGFARGSRFSVVNAEPTRAVFKLGASDETQRKYPFAFELDVEFQLAGPTLTIESIIRNRGSKVMPASLGYHPAFRWPLPYGESRPAHYIEFEADEPAPVRMLDSDGLVKPEPIPTPITGRRLALDDALFRSDAIIFEGIRSRQVFYGAGQGPRIGVSYSDSPYLGVWTKPGANFICIEPWNGLADPQGFAGDFTEKPGISLIPAGGKKAIKIAITLLDK